MFINVIRTGTVKARPLANIMPWAFFRNLSDDDLKAIFAYLRDPEAGAAPRGQYRSGALLQALPRQARVR